MQQRIVQLFTAALLLSACGNNANKEQPHYEIQGTIQGVDSGWAKLQTINDEEGTSKTIDSAKVINGSFKLSGTLGSPQMMVINFEPGNWSFRAFLEDTAITIKVDTSGATHYDYTAYGDKAGAILNTFTVSGSNSNTVWTDYQNGPGAKEFEPVFRALQQQYKEAKTDAQKTQIDHQMDSIRQIMGAKQLAWIKQYITAHPTAEVGTYLVNNYLDLSSDLPASTLEELLALFKGSAKSSPYFKSTSAALSRMKAVEPGSIAPDFSLLQRDSTNLTLSSLRGKYVMIDFWASWCGPCRKAIPHWKNVYEKYSSKGFEIVGVSNDSKWTDWIKAMDDEKMPWLQVIDAFPKKNMPATVSSLYMTSYMPFYVLLDKEGKVLVYSGDGSEIEKKLQTVFGN